MRGHAEAYEVIGFEHFQSLLFRQSQDVPLRSFDSIVTNALFNLDGAISPRGRSMLRPYNFTASAFVVAHSMGLACGIKPRFAAYAKYNSRPRRFSSSSEKSMFWRK